jgi:hypothetical protein
MRTVLFILLLLPANLLRAQDSLRSRSILLEVGGNGGFYSVNFEKDFRHVLPAEFKWEAGFAVLPFGNRVILDFPYSINYICGKKKHAAEFGTGQVFMLDIKGGTGGFIRGTFHLGYRYQPEGKRWFFNAAYTPFYSWIVNFQYEHWFALGIGYRLNPK